MATQTETETATATATRSETTLTLEPPQPLQNVTTEQAAGLVPLKEEQKSALEEKVDTFISELVALDANSPEFGKKVDQLTGMGRKEIAEAAGASNRFLDRPVKAIDKDTGIGANLTAVAEDGRGPRSRPRRRAGQAEQAVRHHPLGQFAARLFHEIPVGADPHRRDPRRARLRQGRAPDGQCGDRRRARQPVEDDGQIGADDPHLQGARREARGQGQRARRDRPGQGQGDPRDRALLHPPAHHRPSDPDGGHRAGLSRARPRQEEQCRAGEGRRPRLDHHRRGAAHRGHRRPGADQPAAGARADHRAQHHHRQHDRIDRRAA